MKKFYAICRIFCAIVLMSALAGTASAQIVVTNGNPYTTGFENGLEDWTTQANLGTDVWSSIVGEHHAGSRSVNYSSSLFGDFLNIGQGSDDPLTIIMQLMSMMGQLENMGNESAYLISPVMDLGGTGDQASLTFYRKQTSMMTPQILYVMYRTSPSAQWINLQQYTNTTDWTQETVTLPSPCPTYQVAFMGLFNAENMGDIDVTDFMDPNAMTNFASDIYIDDITITSTSNTGISEHSNLLSISPNPTSDIPLPFHQLRQWKRHLRQTADGTDGYQLRCRNRPLRQGLRHLLPAGGGGQQHPHHPKGDSPITPFASGFFLCKNS